MGHVHLAKGDRPAVPALTTARTLTEAAPADAYTARHLSVLEGLEAVRKRPGMYIGSTDSRGLQHCLGEIFDNAVDEALAGHCTGIEVTLHADGSAEVRDNGRGIPVDVERKTKLTGVELVMTRLHAGGKFGGGSYTASGGLHGVGASVVNALAARLEVEISRDGYVWRQAYAVSEPTGPLRRGEPTSETGTIITFWPDPDIFETTVWTFETLSRRLQEMAFLNRGLSITLTDEGRRFCEEVKPHLAAIEEAAAVASGAASAVRGRLKVDIDPFFLPLVLAGRLGAFCERYPELSIEFVTREQVGDLVSDGIDLAIRFGQPRFATLVSRKLIEAPILTLSSPSYLKRYGKPKHPSDLSRHRCLQFLDPYTKRPFDWEFIRGKETVEVPTSGPLTFTDPKSMLEECVAGTGIAQVIGWGIKGLLASGALIDLFPDWHGERFPLFAFHPSRKHPPAKVRAFVEFCAKVIQQL